MSSSLRYTSSDLAHLPDVEGKRYEIIDGDLYVSKQPHYYHQRACMRVGHALESWNDEAGLGETSVAPGLVFDDDDDVAPDLVWTSKERLPQIIDASGHFRAAPELVIEVLSFGARNEQRDREFKLKLYSRQGVREYWILDWQLRRVQIFRRVEAALELVGTYEAEDLVTSPLLPGFRCPVSRFW
jgi:Uma2 family endonuclease